MLEGKACMSRARRAILALILGACARRLRGLRAVPGLLLRGIELRPRLERGAGRRAGRGRADHLGRASTGLIRGTADGGDVLVTVARQADGSVRVQFDAKGPAQRELAERFSRAYDRRMGR